MLYNLGGYSEYNLWGPKTPNFYQFINVNGVYVAVNDWWHNLTLLTGCLSQNYLHFLKFWYCYLSLPERKKNVLRTSIECSVLCGFIIVKSCFLISLHY
jgi:hypothetical protein